MRGPGYSLVTDLLVAAGHTRGPASAAVARIEFDVPDFVQATVGSTGRRFSRERHGGYVDGWYDGSVTAKAGPAEHAERARVEARRGGIAVPPGPTPPDPAPVDPGPANPGRVFGTALVVLVVRPAGSPGCSRCPGGPERCAGRPGGPSWRAEGS